MIQRSTLLHLRIPFSYFLLPVFLFAWAAAPTAAGWRIGSVFVILHFLLYPASNGYNSYFDRDEQSIGGLKHPPKVSLQLYYIALLFDFIALAWAITLGWSFALLIFAYGMASKAYSHPAIRLKKMPFAGWFVAGFFQGYVTFIMTYLGVTGASFSETFTASIQIPAILSTMLLFGSYPMTQIYQHDEDGKRGDETISRKLGILGTFHFTAIAFIFSAAGFAYFFLKFHSPNHLIYFQIALLPVLVYFGYWYWITRKNTQMANYENTMRLNLLSSSAFNLFFLGMIVHG